MTASHDSVETEHPWHGQDPGSPSAQTRTELCKATAAETMSAFVDAASHCHCSNLLFT